MESKPWSSAFLRLLVLIVGLVLVLETIRVLSISVTFHALTENLGDARSFAGIAAGFFVGSLSVLPSSRRRNKNRSRSTRGPAYGYWTNKVTAFKRVDEFRRLETLVSQHSAVR